MRPAAPTARRILLAVFVVAGAATGPVFPVPSAAQEEDAEGGEDSSASVYFEVGSPEEAPDDADGPQEGDYGAPEDPGRFRTFVEDVARLVDQTWSGAFTAGSLDYRAPALVLSEGEEEIESGCEPVLGHKRDKALKTSPAFYCPEQEKQTIYLSLQWLGDRPRYHGAFAVASVIAHEFGHHVQFLLGIWDRPDAEPGIVEYEADCLSGIWAFAEYGEKQLPDEQVDGAMELQYENTRDGGEHGDAEAREEWFRDGFRDGEAEDCDSWRWND